MEELNQNLKFYEMLMLQIQGNQMQFHSAEKDPSYLCPPHNNSIYTMDPDINFISHLLSTLQFTSILLSVYHLMFRRRPSIGGIQGGNLHPSSRIL